MRQLLIFNLTIILFLAACTTEKQDSQSNNFKEITTYLQIDSSKTFIKSLQHIDSTGKEVELILYYSDGQIKSIIKSYYNSLVKPSLVTQTDFSPNKPPSVSTFQYFYDDTGYLIKDLSVRSWNPKDTITTFYFYDSNKKLVKQKTITSLDNSVMWKGVAHYLYDSQNRLIKKLNCDLNEEKYQNYDSIVYTDTSKTIFEFHFAGELSSKKVTVLRNKKPIKDIEYRMASFSKKLNLDSETKYFYDNKDSLIKKINLIHEKTDWCGFESPRRLQIYTYDYLDKK